MSDVDFEEVVRQFDALSLRVEALERLAQEEHAPTIAEHGERLDTVDVRLNRHETELSRLDDIGNTLRELRDSNRRIEALLARDIEPRPTPRMHDV